MTRYSYPGGKSISSLSLVLSLPVSPVPVITAFVPTSPILDHSNNAPPCQTLFATHRRTTHSPLMPESPLFVLRPFVSNYSRGLTPPCRHVVFFLITTTTSLNVFVRIAAEVTGAATAF